MFFRVVNEKIHSVYPIKLFPPSQESLVWLELKIREKLMSPECSKHQLLSFFQMIVVWSTNKKFSVLISVLQTAQ